MNVKFNCKVLPETFQIPRLSVGCDGDTLGLQVLVEQQDLGGAQLGEDLPQTGIAVELLEERAGGKVGQLGGNVGEEVKWVSQQHRLEGGNGLNLSSVGEYFCLVPDDAGVADCQTVEKVEEDNDNQEDEAEEENVSKWSQLAVQVDGDVTELQLPREHGGRLYQR